MAIIRICLARGLGNLHRTLFSCTEHLMWSHIPSVSSSQGRWVPPVDILETSQNLIVIIPCPGAKKEKFEILLDGCFLHIKGFRDLPIKGAKIYQLEGEYGPFERIIKLPAPVRNEGAEAIFKEGFLKILLPKHQH